jgi:hypothetical protein
MNHLATRPAAWSAQPNHAEQAGLVLRTMVRSAFSRWGAMAVVAVALLGAFQYVVGESVLRGQALSRDMTTQAAALWHCNGLRDVQGRADCRERVRAAREPRPAGPPA